MSVAKKTKKSETEVDATVWKTVHRVVFPIDGDTDTLPLYVDFNAAQRVVSTEESTAKSGAKSGANATTAAASSNVSGSRQRTDYIKGRREIRLPAFRRVSLGTYFNAFPASYWRAHTDVEQVRLTVETDGDATVIVYRSTPRGTANRVESLQVSQGSPVTIDLSIMNFADGGWYWFDLATSEAAITLTNAHWSVPQPEGFQAGTLSVGVTTFNRPDFCVKHLRTFAESPDLTEVLDELIVTDQGNQRVRDEEGFEEAAANLGHRFRLVEQANLGGSGGFARGMQETVKAGKSKYVMLLDDDVLIETEGILRAVQFADFTRRPTIVGGHMFNLYERSVVHNFGETINEYRFRYESAGASQEVHDFGASNLRTTPWMHRRIDVDYNGWWMCLIPTSIIEEIGLSLPVFIKWDDVEYGIRAKAHGFTTVTLPGAAVWHMPWTEKDDTIDWQAYFHQRNRWLATMLHSPYSRGGRMPIESMMVDLRHLLSMQYSAVELRLQALEDLLDGPDHLHRNIGTKLPEIRRVRSTFSDAQVSKDLAKFPPVKRVKPPKFGHIPSAPATMPAIVTQALSAVINAARDPREGAVDFPEAVVPAMDARWWRLAKLNSALVSASDGAGASWYKRDAKTFRKYMIRSVSLHQKLMRRWDELSKTYQDELPNFTSPEVWEKTFAANPAPVLPVETVTDK
ncbi:glycosyltransferase [Arthrobacter psychrochitiniphilus]|uniref:glycosyltransferase n=1 Tax=Arthrobacter psychrochitiniphilus TaxID=291045 RepID=UPI003F7C4845